MKSDTISLEETKQSRYQLDYFAFAQLQRDHIRFKQEFSDKFSNEFIRHILINSLKDIYDNQKNVLEEMMEYIMNEKKGCNYEADEFLVEYKTMSDYSDILMFNRELKKEISCFDFVDKKNFNKRKLISYLLYRFTRLPLCERERIYCYTQYQTIKEAIKEKKMLQIYYYDNKKIFEIKPYRCMVDDNSLSYYLTGYSRYKGSGDDFTCNSIKLTRIKDCRITNIPADDTDIFKIQKILEKFGAARVIRNLEPKNIMKSEIHLTEYGYEILFLKRLNYQRPLPIKEPELVVAENGKKFYRLFFDCSFDLLIDYFLKFGHHAEIISPDRLKNMVKEKLSEYSEVLKKY